jgi:hypothetical protein
MSGSPLTFVVDRIEESLAVLIPENKAREEVISLSLLPRGTREGSVIRVDAGAGAAWRTARLDEARCRELEERAEQGLRKLRRRDPGGLSTLSR